MCPSLLDSILVDVDQQKGSADKNAIIEDYCVPYDPKEKGKALIETATGLKLFVAVVADGGGKIAPHRAAKLAVDTILEEVRRSKEANPISILRNALSVANQAVYQLANGEDYVGLTIVVMKDDRIYTGQAGKLTRAYLVKNSREKEQIQSNLNDVICLGDMLDNPNMLVEDKGVIKRGERIIMCSDGLFDPPTDPSRPDIRGEIEAKVEKEIPIVGQYDDIRGAARHLSSIGKGMDVGDDITVVVLGFGRKPAKPSTAVIAISSFVIVALLIVILIISIPRPQPPRPPDLGVTVLIKGNSVAQLVYPGDEFQADGPANLKLETRPNLTSGTPEIIQGIDLYLADKTDVSFDAINLASFSGAKNQPTDPALLNTTQIILKNGRILIVSDGNRKYAILIPVQDKFIQIILNYGGKGILGVTRNGAGVETYCLKGNCQVLPIKGDAISFFSPRKTNMDINTPNNIPLGEPITEADWKLWNTLCNGGQPGSCDLSK